MAYPTYSRGYKPPFDPYVEDEEEDPLSSSRPMTQRLSALLPQNDEGLNRRWRDAEEKALDDATPETYGAAEGFRDFAPMAVGASLDILLNKGKGLGALTGAGMQALSSESKRRDTARAQAAKEALAIKQQREAGGDRMTNAMHALLRGDELEQQIAASKAKLGSPEEQAEARAGERAKTAAETRNITAEAVEREKYPGAGMILKYLQMGNAKDQAAARLALDEAKLEEQKRSNTLKEEGIKQERERVHKEKRDAAKARNAKDYNRMGKGDLAQAQVLSEVEPILLKYGNKDRPGIGEVDSRLWNKFQRFTGGNEDESIKLKSAIGKLFTYFSLGATGKASSDKERLYNQIATQLREGASEAETTVGLNAARKEIRGQLRGLGAQDEETAREVLREMGLEDFIYGPDIEYGRDTAYPASDKPPSLQPLDPDAPAGAAPPPSSGKLPPAAATTAVAPTTVTDDTIVPRSQAKEFKTLMGKIPEHMRQGIMETLAGIPANERLARLRGLLNEAPAGGDLSLDDVDVTNPDDLGNLLDRIPQAPPAPEGKSKDRFGGRKRGGKR